MIGYDNAGVLSEKLAGGLGVGVFCHFKALSASFNKPKINLTTPKATYNPCYFVAIFMDYRQLYQPAGVAH
jgi:hypothetical protein